MEPNLLHKYIAAMKCLGVVSSEPFNIFLDERGFNDLRDRLNSEKIPVTGGGYAPHIDEDVTQIDLKYLGYSLTFSLYKLKTDNMLKTTLTAEGARKLTEESEAHFNNCMDLCFKEIKVAAGRGHRKVLFPVSPKSSGDVIISKVKDELTLLGYKLDWWDSSTSNTTIHW